MTLVIGGSENGKIVNWPMDREYWIVPIIDQPQVALQYKEPDPVGSPIRKEYYRIEKLNLFGNKIWIWVHESIKHWDDPRDLGKLLLPEILSYKGARMFLDSGVNL